MAERLLAAGHEVCVYNRTLAKAIPLKKHNAKVTNDPQEAITYGSCVILLLSDARAIQDVLFTPARAILRKRVIIQMGTIAPIESEKFLRRMRIAGGQYLECPVLGSRAEAKDGRLILMLGSTREQYLKWKKFLTCFGSRPYWIGPVGKAAALKLALNQLIASHAVAIAASAGLVRRYGVPMKIFSQILRPSALYAPMFDKKLPRMLKGDYARPNFSVKHLLKDVELFLRTARAADLSVAHVVGIRKILQQTCQKGWGDADYSALFDIVVPSG